jgi:hypothetical protein
VEKFKEWRWIANKAELIDLRWTERSIFEVLEVWKDVIKERKSGSLDESIKYDIVS